MDKPKPTEKQSELDLVRETLADHILTILNTKGTAPSGGTNQTLPEDLQCLLCAAVADLERIDDQLHHQRLSHQH